ncbi:DUF3050 domain-containing protein [Chitinophaga horti]|uniref:DUF3050 domain-containing protein n=1 Tax=Chitinophaga horti TaxID=2920382 RepID=A0ABY6IZM2_9BACT|nr:DUF3050 domain-containing protein [Chitinophaga horti]UYQ92825.1 DUF3050 domain-containing protein [Chitinophaga horti]
MNIERLQQAIAPAREQVITHSLYQKLQSLEDVKLFMQHHIFAVWDFMSLLKALQRELTCVSLPWVPKGTPDTRYLINEIVTGEESDVDELGNRCSHFELYLRAMQQAGADTAPMLQLLKEATKAPIDEVLSESVLPGAVTGFLQFTFGVIASAKLHVMAAIFTFGREDLIPDMFHELVQDLDAKFPGTLSIFKYYLERHIEVDGGHHSQLAQEMVIALCGNDEQKWNEATAASIAALEWRAKLWSGVLQ